MYECMPECVSWSPDTLSRRQFMVRSLKAINVKPPK